MFYVVCDANGECKGIFSNKETANKLADYYGAYVSEHKLLDILPSEVDQFINNVNK